MKLKTFGELLRENNVKRPFFLKEIFTRNWIPVAEEYEEYCLELEKRNARWEDIREAFAKNWGKVIPALEDLEPIPTFRFNDYKQAKTEISKARKRTEARSLMYLEEQLEIEARTEWLEELVKKADENCKLIVIKGDYMPNNEVVTTFNAHVAQGRAGSICSQTSTVWIAFNPKAHVSVLDWGMKKNTSTVEYIN